MNDKKSNAREQKSLVLVAESDGPTVWLIEKGTRKHVPNSSTLRHLRKRYGPVVTKPRQEIEKYVTGPRVPSLEPQLRRDEDKRCYLVVAETKREIKDKRIVNYLADGQTLITATSESLASLQNLSPLLLSDGEKMAVSSFHLVQACGEDEVFLLKDPFVRLIPRINILEALTKHLNLGPIEWLPNDQLETYIEGPPILEQFFKERSSNTAAIRDLLGAAFSDEDLTTFCYDYFHPVFEQFGTGMSKSEKIQRLIEHCDRHRSLDQLIARVREHNPAQFARFEAQPSIDCDLKKS